MVDARFAAYVALMGLLIVIPGPDMLMVTRTVLRSGRRAGFVVAWGVAAGIAAPAVPRSPRPGAPPLRLALMLLAFEAMLLLWLYLYASTLASAGRSPLGIALRCGIERAAGVVLVGLGVTLAFERR